MKNHSPHQTIKSNCSICNSVFQNFKISHLKQLCQEHQTVSMIVFVISVWDVKRPLLLAARVNVYLQSKFKVSLFSLDGMRTTSFWPILTLREKSLTSVVLGEHFFTHQRFSNGKHCPCTSIVKKGGSDPLRALLIYKNICEPFQWTIYVSLSNVSCVTVSKAQSFEHLYVWINAPYEIKVSRVDWLGNLKTFFVICFCSPFPYWNMMLPCTNNK